MRILVLALFAEGPGDYLFLPSVLRRTAQALLERASDLVIVSDNVFKLDTPAAYRGEDRDVQILEATRESGEAFDILFIHTDAAGNAREARQQRVEPAMRQIAEQTALRHVRTVAVVPVRETEAWALVDGGALRDVLTKTSDTDLGVPARPAQVERILDPKHVLHEALVRAIGERGAAKGTVGDFLEAFGERVGLARLRQVPAFRRFEGDLRVALVDLGYLQQEPK